MRRETTSEDFDDVFEIYMDRTVNPFVNFELMSKKDFRSIFTEMTTGGGFEVYELAGEVGGCLTNVSYVAIGVNQTELLSQISSLQIAI